MENLGKIYVPKSALVVYQGEERKDDIYVEYFDMDENGFPINAHPLSLSEAQGLAKSLSVKTKAEKDFLKPENILPANVLHINAVEQGRVIWFTKSISRSLFFSDKLGIPNKTANIPPMVWVADKTRLSVYAVQSNKRPTADTVLYNAPFFNIYKNANVCMGNIDVRIKESASLEEFISAWEAFFFNSYFTGLIDGHNPVRNNLVLIWKKLVGTADPFPKAELLRLKLTLKDLIQ